MSRGLRPAERTRICLACRTLFDAGESCPGGKAHQTVSLRERAGRARLEDEVWGPDSRARKARQAAKAGAGGVSIGSVLEGCAGCDAGGLENCAGGGGEALVAAVAILVVGGIAILLFWLARFVVRWVREKLERPKPHGALLRPPRPKSRAVVASGVVRAGSPMSVPWTAGSAFAYAMELYEARPFGGGAMLREAVGSELEIALDDGRSVRIPAGRIQVLGKLPAVVAERTRLEGRLGQLDPARSSAGSPLFPFEQVRARALGPGDRVEILGALVDAPTSVEGGYRAHAGALVPVGVPVLRILQGPRLAADAAPPLAWNEELEDEPEREPAEHERVTRT